MRIHHLNCGSLCPRGGRFFGGEGGPLSTAPMCCHCLLIEGEDGLTLVDSGLGLEDVADLDAVGGDSSVQEVLDAPIEHLENVGRQPLGSSGL